MNVVNLCFYAEGYYSGQTYEENVLISEELFEKIKDKVSDMKVSVADLDGKYSEVLGKIEAQACDESKITDWYGSSDSDGEKFRENLYYLCEYLGLDLSEDENRVNKFIASIDYKVDVTVSVRKSKKAELLKFVETLE